MLAHSPASSKNGRPFCRGGRFFIFLYSMICDLQGALGHLHPAGCVDGIYRDPFPFLPEGFRQADRPFAGGGQVKAEMLVGRGGIGLLAS